jgi:pilus assembly protein TadC
MRSEIEIGQILFQGLNVLFLLWPLAIAAPLLMRKNKLRTIALSWVCLALIRPIYAVSKYPKLEFIMGEPLYTLLFAVLGFAILNIWLVNKWPYREAKG